MIKAAFFDMDGTLYSHTSRSIPDSTLRSLEKLRKNNVKIFLATGRHFKEIDDFPVGQISFDGYVMLTGQICTDAGRNLVYGNAIEGEDAKKLLDIFKEKIIPAILVEKDRLYLNFINDEVLKGQAEISSEVPEIGEYRGAPLYQMVCFGGKELEEKLSPQLYKCKMSRWCPYGVDIISKEGGKVTGIRKLLELHGIYQEEIIAFGDGENDMDMLEFAGIGVAMGNAEESVKAIADYVTKPIDEDGIYEALKHFELV